MNTDRQVPHILGSRNVTQLSTVFTDFSSSHLQSNGVVEDNGALCSLIAGGDKGQREANLVVIMLLCAVSRYAFALKVESP